MLQIFTWIEEGKQLVLAQDCIALTNLVWFLGVCVFVNSVWLFDILYTSYFIPSYSAVSFYLWAGRDLIYCSAVTEKHVNREKTRAKPTCHTWSNILQRSNGNIQKNKKAPKSAVFACQRRVHLKNPFWHCRFIWLYFTRSGEGIKAPQGGACPMHNLFIYLSSFFPQGCVIFSDSSPQRGRQGLSIISGVRKRSQYQTVERTQKYVSCLLWSSFAVSNNRFLSSLLCQYAGVWAHVCVRETEIEH